MRTLFAIVLLAIAGYTGFWFWELGEAKKGFAAFVAAERARGHRLDYKAADWGGFPSRMEVDLTELVYEAGGLHLDAGALRLEAYPWDPTHAIARADNHPHLAYQDLASPETISIDPSLIIAGLRVAWSGQLKQLDVEFRDPAVHGVSVNGKAFAFTARRLQLDERASRNDQPPTDGVDLALSLDQALLGSGIKPLFGPRIASLRTSVRLAPVPPAAATWPLDWSAIVQSAATAGTSAEIARLDFDWGGVKAAGTGKLTLDAAHRPDGAITFQVQNLRQLVEALLASGAISGDASLLSSLAAPGVSVPITVTLKDGAAMFGPFTAGHLNPLK